MYLIISNVRKSCAMHCRAQWPLSYVLFPLPALTFVVLFSYADRKKIASKNVYILLQNSTKIFKKIFKMFKIKIYLFILSSNYIKLCKLCKLDIYFVSQPSRSLTAHLRDSVFSVKGTGSNLP